MIARLKKLSIEEHVELAKDIKKAQIILSPHLEALWKSYGVNSKEGKLFRQMLVLLTSKLCNELDKRFYEFADEELLKANNAGLIDYYNGSPYYNNSGITHY